MDSDFRNFIGSFYITNLQGPVLFPIFRQEIYENIKKMS